MNGQRSGRRVSAVIRAYNKGAQIGWLLEGFEQQTVWPGEIIVVDPGATGNTTTIAERRVALWSISPKTSSPVDVP